MSDLLVPNQKDRAAFQQANTIVMKALEIRDMALEAYDEAKSDTDLLAHGFDPGDAHVTIAGNRHNVLTVLNFLALLGIPGCKPQ